MGILKKEDLPEYTYADYQQWGGDWELIEGIPYAMVPAPVKKHQRLVLAIGSHLLARLNECPDCEVLIDEDWKLDSRTVLKPDVAVVCHDDSPDYIARTPEVIFEVLSLSTAKRDEGVKFNMYQEEGVKYCNLIYPEGAVAKVYKHNGEKLIKVAECDTETFAYDDVTCPFECEFSTIFKHFRGK